MAEAPECVIFYMARHGTTGLNRANCFRGNKDVPLDDQGVRDAHALRKLFEDIPLSFIISSDRIRATKTADIVHEGRDIAKKSTPVLHALNVGDFSGKERSKENIAALQEYLDHPDETIPGGESLNDFKDRIGLAFWEILGLADDSGLPAMVVCHSSIIHEVGSILYGSHQAILVEPGGVVAVYIRNGKIGADPIWKPVRNQPVPQRADTVS